MNWLFRILHLLFGGTFVYAGVLKAMDPGLFLLDIRSFDILPDPYAAFLAMGLPWLEILAGLAVVTSILRPGGLLVLNGLLLSFLGAILLSWYRGIDIRCGCFGSPDVTSNYIELLIRDGILLLLDTILMIRSSRANKAKS